MEEEILAASLSSHLPVRQSWREEISYESHYEFITKVIIRKIYNHQVCCKSGFNIKANWFVLGRHIMSDGGGFQIYKFGVVKISMSTYESD